METKYTRAEVALHKTPDDLYIIISGKVFDVTEFQHKHPGGIKSKRCSGPPILPFGFVLRQLTMFQVLKTVAGKDATKPFKKNHNERILTTEQYHHLCIGVLDENELGRKSSLRLSRVLSWSRRRSDAAKSPGLAETMTGSRGAAGTAQEQPLSVCDLLSQHIDKIWLIL